MSFGISDSDREILNWAKKMKEQEAANPQGETKPAANPQGDTNNYSQLDKKIEDLKKEMKQEIKKVNEVNRLQIKGLNTEDRNLRALIDINTKGREALRKEVTVLQTQVKKVAKHVDLKL